MSQQALDMPRVVQTVRRHRILVGIMAVLGLLAGAAYATLHPPMFTGTALILLPEDAQAANPRNPYKTVRQQAPVRSMPIRPFKWWSQAVIQCFQALCRTLIHRYRSRSCGAKLRSRALPPVSFR